jgi:hypothetical protein
MSGSYLQNAVTTHIDHCDDSRFQHFDSPWKCGIRLLEPCCIQKEPCCTPVLLPAADLTGVDLGNGHRYPAFLIVKRYLVQF